MNLDKTRATLTALRDEMRERLVSFPIGQGSPHFRNQIAELDFSTDLLDTEKWPEYAKRLNRFAETKQCDTVCGIEFTTLAVALALVPQLEARVKVLTEALETIKRYDSGNGCCEFGCDTPTIARRALTDAKENEHE